MNNKKRKDLQRRVAPKVKRIVLDAKAKNTRRAYSTDWNQFQSWCLEYGYEALPAEVDTIITHVVMMTEKYKLSTIKRKIATISEAHNIAGVVNPVHTAQFEVFLQGLHKSSNVEKDIEKKKALRVEDLRALCEHFHNDLRGYRNKALILIGFAGGFRRSELVSLTFDQMQFTKSGLLIQMLDTKTDKGSGGIPKDYWEWTVSFNLSGNGLEEMDC